MPWRPAENRYQTMIYNRCGRSGLKLPAISLGLWHNFGGDRPHETKRAICRTGRVGGTPADRPARNNSGNMTCRRR